MNRPPDRWSIVIADIAVAAGVRADICTIEVPSLMLLGVRAPPGERGQASRMPYASAVQTESKPEPVGLLDRFECAGGRARPTSSRWSSRA